MGQIEKFNSGSKHTSHEIGAKRRGKTGNKARKRASRTEQSGEKAASIKGDYPRDRRPTPQTGTSGARQGGEKAAPRD